MAKTRAWRGSIEPGDERPVLGALHERVDVAVDVHVDGVGAAGGQRAADDGGDHQPDRRAAPLGHDHRRHRRDQQQLDDPRLGERHVPRHAGPQRRDASSWPSAADRRHAAHARDNRRRGSVPYDRAGARRCRDPALDALARAPGPSGSAPRSSGAHTGLDLRPPDLAGPARRSVVLGRPPADRGGRRHHDHAARARWSPRRTSAIR